MVTNRNYEVRIKYNTEYIKKNLKWELVGIFADEDISRADTYIYVELNCLKYIRQLKDMNITVLFKKENINSMNFKGRYC